MRPSSGKAMVAGMPARLARASVGVVSHTTFLYDELTVKENLCFYADLYGAPMERTGWLLEQVAMAHVADVQVGRLSRGQQQRIAIARALVHDPPVLLLDEPDTGLDIAAFGLLENLLLSSHHTVILTTHNLLAGVRLATRAAVLARGHLVEQWPSLSTQDAAPLADLLEVLARG
jgi:ABC-type multidrug transport system ATPase subunit